MPEYTVTETGEPFPTLDSYTPVSTVGAMLIDAMGPWLTLHLAWYLDAIGVMFDPVYSLVADQGFDGDPDYVPGYGSLFAPATCPDADLPYLAQFVGVQIPPGTSPADARSLILNEPGRLRGSTGSIIAAAKRCLTGTKSVYLVERMSPAGPDPDWFELIVRPEELPEGLEWEDETSSWAGDTATWGAGDPKQALIDAVNLAKPGGVMWFLTFSDGFTWSSAVHHWSDDMFTWAQSAAIQP